MADMRYMGQLQAVVNAGVALIRRKTETYGDSWKRRGGAGAWFTTVRPWDRLEGILARYNGDVLEAISAEGGRGDDGSVLACIRDVRNYLTLIEAEVVAQGVVTVLADGSAPWTREQSMLDEARAKGALAPGTPEDGGHHAREPLEDAGEAPSRPPVGAGPERLRAVEGLPRLLRDALIVAGLGDAEIEHASMRMGQTHVFTITVPLV